MNRWPLMRSPGVTMVTISAMLQAPIQAIVRPSMWLPCIRRFHSFKEIWHVDADHAAFMTALLEAFRKLMAQEDCKETFDIHKISEEQTFIRVFAFTRAEWLDVMEIQYCKDGLYEVQSFSSGLCPLIVPFACLLNMAFFWVPFFDSDFNQHRIQRLRESMNINVNIQDS